MPSTNPLDYAPCQVPLRRATNVFGGVSITAHAGCYYDILEASRRWEKAGGDAFWDVRQADTGSYNCRPSAGHSRGVAIDFNWSTNEMTRKQTPCPGDMPAAFYELCWKPLGYGWGNNWNSKCDRMHISKLMSEGGDGVLYRTWAEEDDVDEATFKRWLTEWTTGEFDKPKWGAFKPIYLRFEIAGVSVDGIQAIYNEVKGGV